MRWPDPPAPARRTPLELARDELSANLRQEGDAVTVAAVLHFVDTVRDNLRAKFGGINAYDAEAMAFGRIATEIETAAGLAGMRMPNTEQLAAIMAPAAAPVVDPDEDLDRLDDSDRERAQVKANRARYKPSKWNRRRNKRGS